MAYSIFNNPQKTGLSSTTREEIAKEVAGILSGNGIDVVDGLDAEAAWGRKPLSYFLLVSYSNAIVVGSIADGAIDYLEKATKERYPGKYFLSSDDGAYPSGSAIENGNVTHVMAKARQSVDMVARLSIYYQEPHRLGEVVYAGDIVYDPSNGIGSLRFERGPECRPEISPSVYDQIGRNAELRIALTPDAGIWRASEYATESTVFGTDETIDLSEMVRRAIQFPIETTGARIASAYGRFEVTVPKLPNSSFLTDFGKRMTYDLDAEDHDAWYGKPKISEEFATEPLDPEELEEAIPILKADLESQLEQRNGRRKGRPYYGSPNIYTSYAMVISPAPKGERRPVGHIVVGAYDGVHYEFCEFAVCRTAANFTITDIYLKTSKGGVVAYRRCDGRTMTGLKEMIGDPKILKSTLSHAKNIRNRYAASAAISSKEDEIGASSVPASILRSIASLRFGAEFVEWSYRMGYVGLADELCRTINSRRAWDRVTAMQDIIPGYVEGAKSLYTCLGMPKAWGKAAFDLCVASRGEDFGKSDVHDAVLSLQIAWELESALSDGKPSEASVPARAYDYAAIWREHLDDFGLSSGRRTGNRREQWIFAAYGEDPIGMANAVRSFHRMSKKAAKLGLGDKQSQVYLLETFQAYCQLKSIGEVPEDHGVLYEYGLPEDDIFAAAAMLERRCSAAQDVLNGYRAIIDEKAHAIQEGKYAEHRKAMSWLECADPEVSRSYVFKLPTKLYGLDDSLSLQSEGSMQSNCVFGSYLSKLENGEYTIVLMRSRNKADSSLVTIGISKNMVVDQTYGAYNSQIEPAEGRAIKAWIQKVNSRGKGTVSISGHPGGWNE